MRRGWRHCLSLLLGIEHVHGFVTGPISAASTGAAVGLHGARGMRVGGVGCSPLSKHSLDSTPSGEIRASSRRAAQPTASAAGSFSRGRQWNGKPVLDTVVLHPHSDIAQPYWASVMEAGDLVLDATCGNGWDTLFLLRSLAAAGGGTIVSCDVQALAFEKSKALLARELEGLLDMEEIPEQGHSVWAASPTEQFRAQNPGAGSVTLRWALQPSSVKVVVFNLGYLPGGDKTIVTTPDVTLRTIQAARRALKAGGCISATCYPGHEEGRLEESSIFEDARQLPVEVWSCYVHQWINQRNKRTGKRAPSLVLYQRVSSDPPHEASS